MHADATTNASDHGPWAALRRFAQPPSPAAERCELCSAALPAEHEHLVAPARRQLLCACRACAILFDQQDGVGGDRARYRRVPRRSRMLEDFQLSDGQWDALAVPIGLAFFFYNSPLARTVAIYPSPAGPTESLLELDAWQEIRDANPALAGMAPDTEALLVHRIGTARESYLVPIDQAYKLVGLIRARWQGFSGGSAVWEEIDRFFAPLRK